MGLLSKIFKARKLSSEDYVRLAELEQALRSTPTDSATLIKYEKNLGEFRAVINQYWGSGIEEYKRLLDLYDGILGRANRAVSKMGIKLR